MSLPAWTPRSADGATSVGDLREEEILEAFLPPLRLASADVGPGDDAAVLPPSSGRVVVTTDSMVLGLDWRDDWSRPEDVGRKVIAQNIADVLAMGARPTGVVVALASEQGTSLDWIVALAEGMSSELERAGTGVLGGDLSGVPDGVVLTVTALGELPPGQEPFRRSAARIGDAVVVSDRLGRSHAGLLLLNDTARIDATAAPATQELADECVAFHRAPWPRYTAADEARAAGVRCAMDVSDGLVRDAARIARASDVTIDLDGAAVEAMAQELRAVVAEAAPECVLGGGEEHCLLGTTRPDAVPAGWRVLGQVRGRPAVSCSEGDRTPELVTLDGRSASARGWDHFAG